MDNRINEIVNSERIDIETSMNILINAVQEKYDEYAGLVENMFEKRDLLAECKQIFIL